MENFKHDAHHLDKYKAFQDLYDIDDLEKLVKLYDIYELVSFLPPSPTPKQKEVLNQLIGVTSESGYMDFTRSTNTFELIMRWQEETGNFGPHHMPSNGLDS